MERSAAPSAPQPQRTWYYTGSLAQVPPKKAILLRAGAELAGDKYVLLSEAELSTARAGQPAAPMGRAACPAPVSSEDVTGEADALCEAIWVASGDVSVDVVRRVLVYFGIMPDRALTEGERLLAGELARQLETLKDCFDAFQKDPANDATAKQNARTKLLVTPWGWNWRQCHPGCEI